MWSFTTGIDRLEEVKHSLLIENRFSFEGAVLYYLDTGMNMMRFHFACCTVLTEFDISECVLLMSQMGTALAL